MPTRTRNIIARRGDTLQRQFNLVPGPESDIEDFGAELIIYNDDGSILHSATNEDSQLVPHNGYINLDIPAETTGGLEITGLARRGKVSEPAPCGELPFVGEGPIASLILRVTSPGGVVKTLLKGLFCFDGD